MFRCGADNDQPAGTIVDESRSARSLADIASRALMVPKEQIWVQAVSRGANVAVILDGRVPHACPLELFTEGGPGTIIRP